MFEASQRHGHLLSAGSFYRFVDEKGHQIVANEDFAACYCLNNGRPSHPPSFMVKLMLLQAHDGVSEREAIERATFDLRWKIALGLSTEEPCPVSRSALQLFRGRLILHESEAIPFHRSVTACVEAGFLAKEMVVAVDSSPLFGRGAMKDTYNLLGDGVKLVLRAAGAALQRQAEALAAELGLSRYASAKIALASQRPSDRWWPKSQRRATAGSLPRATSSSI